MKNNNFNLNYLSPKPLYSLVLITVQTYILSLNNAKTSNRQTSLLTSFNHSPDMQNSYLCSKEIIHEKAKNTNEWILICIEQLKQRVSYPN